MYENETSSIVAYALNSFDYKKSFEELTSKKVINEQSPLSKKRTASEKDKSDIDEKASGLLGFLRTKDSKGDLLNSTLTSSQSEVV